jgi:hypothetical protein
MQIQSGDTWHPWHRPLDRYSAPADICKEWIMTDQPETPDLPPDSSSLSEESGRFLRGIGQWGGWTLNYTDHRIRSIERMEANGDVHVERTNSGYMVVTLTAQSAHWASFYTAQADLRDEAARLTAQLEEMLNRNPRVIYPALQAATDDLNKALEYVEQGGDDDLLRAAASHLLHALYDTKLVSKPVSDEAAS